MAMNVKPFKNWVKEKWNNSVNWILKNQVKSLVIGVLIFLIGLLIVNLFPETCWPKKLGITETSQCCNPGVLIVRLGYAIGGVIALLVAVASFERVRALDETARAQNQTAEAQNKIADAQNKTARAQEQGNIEDRYKNAIEQFGNTNPSVRLAGAYGLYHLAKDNKDRRVNICNVLCAHIRTLTTSEEPVFNKKSYSERYKAKPSDEVQSILDLLTNRNNEKDFPFKSHWINLENAYLNGANLFSAQLQRAYLKEAQLQGADLSSAQLQGAYLYEAQLQGAYLTEAQLQGADLEKAQFQGANLYQAQLQGANLIKAQLQGANLHEAQLQGARLWEAQLQGADLWGAQLQGANLYKAQLQGAYLEYAQLQGTGLKEAQLQGADLFEAQLQGALLKKTNFSGAFSVAFTEQNIRIDFNIDDTINQLKARSDKETELEIVCFSGGVGKYELDNFKKTTAETLEELNKIKNYDQHKINDFKNRMNRVEKILEDNIDKPIDTSIPSEAITGIYPKAEADKIIAMLEKIKKTTEPNN